MVAENIIFHYKVIFGVRYGEERAQQVWLIFEVWAHVMKVSTRFKFFQPRFTERLVLGLNVVVLDAELQALPNGATFIWGHRAKRHLTRENA